MLTANLRRVTSCCETQISGKGESKQEYSVLRSVGLVVIDLKVLYLSIE